ncbi:S1/P1 nuclease [Mucilaginibacter calamicampi]|uniref:S1/P1 nuclease n=1 Tax=Mucilaginibacter calamicampi TaxID=1302352 RepID=A0ABW2Z0C6_9SPHI
MKKYATFAFISFTILSLLSWGYKGHRAIALIAQNHLTPKAKTAIADLLNGESIEDASTWADELRSDPTYRNTSSWHFLNLPSGLTYKAFTTNIESQKGDNLYVALNRSIHVLSHDTNPIETRREALKFIIHLVGDAHQPMHVAGAADKGGNTVQVRFDNKGTNLHTLWDSRLIDHEGLSDVEMSIDYDKATTEQIKQWQSDIIMKWLWESYQASSKIYATTSTGDKLGDDYYKTNIRIIQGRVQKAGIRLAGLLNELLKDYKPTTVSNPYPPNVVSADGTYAETAGIKHIKTKDVGRFIGSDVIVVDTVYSVKDMGSFVLVNLGAEYPNQIATVVLRGDARTYMNSIQGKPVSFIGRVVEYKGKPQIEVRSLNAMYFPGLRD